jgi:hypothetical protein
MLLDINMSKQRPTEISLRDPLSRVTRGERKALLIISTTGITIVKAGIVPTKISALGVEFSPTNQKALLIMIALIIIYLLVAFIIHASADFIAWQISHIKSVKKTLYDFQTELKDILKTKLLADADDKKVEEQMQSTLEAHHILIEKLFSRDKITSSLVYPISFIRAMLEFLFPILLAIYSIIVLVC